MPATDQGTILQHPKPVLSANAAPSPLFTVTYEVTRQPGEGGNDKTARPDVFLTFATNWPKWTFATVLLRVFSLFACRASFMLLSET